MTTITQQLPDQEKLNAFLGQVVQDLAAGESGVATYIGDALGLYRAMWGSGPLTPDALARRTGTNARLIHEWLRNQAAGGYVNYYPSTGEFELTPEQAAVLADEESPAFLVGVLEVTAAMWAGADRLVNAFKTGEGVDYGEHDPRLARGVGRLFAPLYKNALIPEWVPAVPGLHEKLERGTRVLDVGCGTGIATILLAQQYPNSQFLGYDLHEEAIEIARSSAAELGLGDRVSFELADATT
ncbi:MAG TPA: methyltransferase domain-containing protein, partial [Tepidiformaceae bacterium]|nr:methyltransferase domain-containing protein [Tepidiformaceae bacterium]